MAPFFNKIRTSRWVIRLTDKLAALCNLMYRTLPSVRRRTQKNRAAIAAFEETRGSFLPINGQALGNLAHLPFGGSIMAHSGCAVIAAYNALLILDCPKPLAEVASKLESHGIILGGAFGAHPEAVSRYFRKEGFAVHSLYGATVKNSRAYDDVFSGKQASILTSWNSHALHGADGAVAGAHTVAIAHVPEGIAVYNAHDRAVEPEIYSSAAEYIDRIHALPIMFTVIG